MKKHLTKQRIVFYMLYLILACTLVFGVTYARYTASVAGTAAAKVASVEMNTSLDLTGLLKDLKPGETKTISFAVNNFKKSSEGTGADVSEVGQEYSVTVSTTANLPLVYTLVPDGGSVSEGAFVLPAEGGDAASPPFVWTGGRLPYSDKGITHTYHLTVEWPENKNDLAYIDEIDLVTLIVDAKQVQPDEVGTTGS